jgi:uroporphyrin-III C-methyltransferase
MEKGKVILVGAGPGDPDLITIKGVKSLQRADVVVYDRLANPELLDFAPPWAEFIYVGKEPKRHRLNQDDINLLLVEKAQEGKNVVRLKGGDPFVFGRGGEECLVLYQAGIEFEVVPGISSSLAVPAYAGIPVTQRHMATSFTVVTGHTASTEDPYGADWSDLPHKGTLVIMMGVRHLPKITEQLIKDGRSPDTPAATIHWGTTQEQVVVQGILANIAEKAQGVRPPAITVVGDVVSLRDQIDWFKPQPAESSTSANLESIPAD